MFVQKSDVLKWIDPVPVDVRKWRCKMLLLKTMMKPVGLFAIGFLSGSCAVAFAFCGIFFHAALSGTLSL
jgi:hypothetical protein